MRDASNLGTWDVGEVAGQAGARRRIDALTARIISSSTTMNIGSSSGGISINGVNISDTTSTTITTAFTTATTIAATFFPLAYHRQLNDVREEMRPQSSQELALAELRSHHTVG